jgi:hypothetical protein
MQFLVNIWNAQDNARSVEFWQNEFMESQDQVLQLIGSNAVLSAENAALRSQINQRGAGGRFTKKSTN